MFGFFILMLSIQSVQNLIISLINIPKVRDSISARIFLINLNDGSRLKCLYSHAIAWSYDLSVSISVHGHFLARVHVAWLDYVLALLGIIYVINRFRIWIKLFFTLFFVVFAK